MNEEYEVLVDGVERRFDTLDEAVAFARATQTEQPSALVLVSDLTLEELVLGWWLR